MPAGASARAGVSLRRRPATGGTLFLDEVGELGLDLQPQLLRVLESRQVRRLGGNQTIAADVRIVAATNRDLKAEVNAHRFRSDLYFRLGVIEIALPPLRGRLDDLAFIVEELLRGMDLADHPAARALLEPPALAALRAHAWPGNIRELRNHVERCLALDLAGAPEVGPPSADPPALDTQAPIRQERDRWVRWFERQYLGRLMEESGGNVTAAARVAGVDRVHLHRLLAKAGLRR